MAKSKISSVLVSEDLEEELGKQTHKKATTGAELEKLYDDTSGRILQERNDFFLPQIRDFIETERWVNLRPEYQRRRRWDSGRILAWVGPDDDLRPVVEDFRASTRLSDLSFIYRSFYVQAWSAFELFVRTLIISYLEDVSDRANDFDSLKKAKLIERNLYHTGVALQQIFENRSNVAIDFYLIAKNAGTSIPKSKEVILNSTPFGIFLKCPSVDGIEEALKRIGFPKFDWDVVGSTAPVRQAFGTQNTRETVHQIAAFLQDAERTRNNIVHRGEGIRAVSEADVRQGLTIFKVIGDALADFLKSKLT